MAKTRRRKIDIKIFFVIFLLEHLVDLIKQIKKNVSYTLELPLLITETVHKFMGAGLDLSLDLLFLLASFMIIIKMMIMTMTRRIIMMMMKSMMIMMKMYLVPLWLEYHCSPPIS